MAVKDQLKILDNKIRQNQADYDLYKKNALRFLLCLLESWMNMNI